MINPIWDKLEKFEVSADGDAFSFVDRLARDNDWSKAYADRVYHEYLRFIYLAAVTGVPVTPSDTVDEAWHLHLCYTKSYWKDLCGEVLRKEIHHNPTKGGDSERRKFWDQYEATLARYAEVFGDEPPQDIWPPARKRFGNAGRHVRVDLDQSLVIKRKWLYASMAALIGMACLSGCTDWSFSGFGDGVETVFWVVLVIIFLVVMIKLIARGGGGGCSGGGAGCSTGCGAGCGGCGGGD